MIFSSQSLIFKVNKTTGNEVALIHGPKTGTGKCHGCSRFRRLRKFSDVFGSFWISSEIFGNACVVFEKSRQSQDKNLTPLTQKNLEGINNRH